ncbi:MAG: hypothetical protein IPL61_12580 [Myxococcales bacterium]|nr:hypothetical protein [Myxococcales bacterium]
MTLDVRQADDGRLTITGIGDPIELWRATRRFFLARRPVQESPLGSYPATTNRDVRQLAAIWRRVFKQIWRDDLEALDDKKAIWTQIQRDLDARLVDADDAQAFADNERFWFAWTRKPAVWMSVMRDQPSRWDLVVDAAKQTIVHFPEALAARASDAADVVATVAYRTGEVVAAPVRGIAAGLFGRLAVPLLVAAAVVGGVVIVPRIWPRPAKPDEAGAS